MSCEDRPRSGRTSTCQNDENLEKDRKTINADRRRTIDEISEITELMPANVNGRFYYETCFRKIGSSVVYKRIKKTLV